MLLTWFIPGHEWMTGSKSQHYEIKMAKNTSRVEKKSKIKISQKKKKTQN